MDLKTLQSEVKKTDKASETPWWGVAELLTGLVEKIGSINGFIKKKIRNKSGYDNATYINDLERLFGEALWYLTALANRYNISLEKAMKENLSINRTRWGSPQSPQQLLFIRKFDEQFPENEQLPTNFEIKFVSENGPNSISWLTVTHVEVDGKKFGNPIDDNQSIEDNYRFHDVLHAGFAAFLGWSPVFRGLVKRKRKSSPEIDKYQDGARAQDREEALTSFIHSEAKRNNYFENTTSLDTEFLNIVVDMIESLEVGVVSKAEWEHCILKSYDIFRLLIKNRSGYVYGSTLEHTLHYKTL